MKGTLYVIATPIGNLDDISLRAVKILSESDIIAAEDTRTTKKILNKYGIEKKMISYNDNNEISKTEMLIESLESGKTVALVSDAGTPCISDPGYRVVKKAQELSIVVKTVPGPSSVVAALSISGLPSNRFFFEGFLPKKKGRKKRIEYLKEIDETVIIFESPYRVNKTLLDIYNIIGDRYVTICREMTKIHEETIYGRLSSLVDIFSDKKNKGEFVILISKGGIN